MLCGEETSLHARSLRLRLQTANDGVYHGQTFASVLCAAAASIQASQPEASQEQRPVSDDLEFEI